MKRTYEVLVEGTITLHISDVIDVVAHSPQQAAVIGKAYMPGLDLNGCEVVESDVEIGEVECKGKWIPPKSYRKRAQRRGGSGAR